jgi:hypothetical protein
VICVPVGQRKGYSDHVPDACGIVKTKDAPESQGMTTELKMQVIELIVKAAPPAKDGGKSIFNQDHPHWARVLELHEAVRVAMAGRSPLSGEVRMEMVYRRCKKGGDALNFINGVADVVQKSRYFEGQDAWAIENDDQIVEFHYQQEPSDADEYTVRISLL